MGDTEQDHASESHLRPVQAAEARPEAAAELQSERAGKQRSELADKPQPIRAAVVTLSDKASAGLRADASGPLLKELLEGMGIEVGDPYVIPDDQSQIEQLLAALADEGTVDLILTTGGTGLAPRDRTPEATRAIADRLAPGFAEAMRAASLAVTPHAMLSRAIAAVRKRTLIINLPGSPKACRENFVVIAPVLDHAVETLRGEAFECGSPAAP